MDSNHLGAWRKSRGLTMDAAAERVGTTASQISKLEKGTRRLTDVWLRRFALAYDTEPAALLAAPPATPPQAVSVSASLQSNGDLLLTVPSGSPIKDTALRVLQLYGRLDRQERERILFRLQHPELDDTPTPESGEAPQSMQIDESRLQQMAESTVDRMAKQAGITLSAAERLRLVADAMEETLAIARNTAPPRAPRRSGDDQNSATSRPKARLRAS